MTTTLTATDKPAMTHIWEDAGLGKAPFRVRTMLSLPSQEMAEKNPLVAQEQGAEVCRSARALGVGLGTCNVCGTGIQNNYVIESADHKRFVCGCDCVLKSGDGGLVESVKLIQRKADRAKRDAARLAKFEAGRPAREAKWEAEKAAKEQWDREQAERAVVITAANQWLIDVLESTPHNGGGFVDSMISELHHRTLGSLSDRCRAILSDIYAKRFGRSGSKAYDAAMDEFEAKTSG